MNPQTNRRIDSPTMAPDANARILAARMRTRVAISSLSRGNSTAHKSIPSATLLFGGQPFPFSFLFPNSSTHPQSLANFLPLSPRGPWRPEHLPPDLHPPPAVPR